MQPLIVMLLALIASETTYLTIKSLPKNKVDKRSLLIDTSVLIDGRILPIARSGLITAPMIIPRSVIRELQYMADKADHEKRERAREGLDMIEQLKSIDNVNITVIDDKSEEKGVDERLIELAQAYGARLCTIDYNLNKAARAQNVIVVNINELAHALRVVHLPGETVDIKLVQPGQESRQAVGYLDDGTMVVVDDAKALIGHTVSAEVTRVLQTTAGKMMFARKSGQTRGGAEGGSRTIADKQTRGAAESSGRMVAEAKQTRGRAEAEGHIVTASKQARATTRGRGRVSTEKRDNAQLQEETQKPKDISPTMTASLTNEENKPEQTTPSRRQQFPKKPGARNSRRRTPEDALVDLANNE